MVMYRNCMLIPPKYFLTPRITHLLQRIEASREVIDAFPLPPEIETNIRRQSILKSSLFSARIEGNPLTLEEVTRKPSTDQKRREVYNILKALQFVHQRGQRDVTNSVLFQMHDKAMDGLIDRGHLGKFRNEVSAIYNAAGIAIYLPPPPRQIPGLIEKLFRFVNSDKEQFVPIRACLAHYVFEKIHPFLDGNGRVGRLLFQVVLQKGGYGMKNLVGVEEYLDKHRSDYYHALEESEKDVTDYIEFMLEAVAEMAEFAKNQVLQKQKAEIADTLLPRRAEIFQIIREQNLVAFDTIRRRFLKINERTLRYDLKKLADMGLIQKLGTTKGVYYKPKEK